MRKTARRSLRDATRSQTRLPPALSVSCHDQPGKGFNTRTLLRQLPAGYETSVVSIHPGSNLINELLLLPASTFSLAPLRLRSVTTCPLPPFGYAHGKPAPCSLASFSTSKGTF